MLDHRRQTQLGFTLIELMIVVAIIGILAATAMSLYQQYAMRTKVIDGMSLVGAAKLAVADNAAAAHPYSRAFSAISAASGATKNVNRLDIDDTTGEITIGYTPAAGGGTLVMVPYTGTPTTPIALPDSAGAYAPPEGSIHWACKSSESTFAVGTAGTLNGRYAPSECR